MSRTAPLWLLLAALGGGLCGCEDDSTGHAARDGGRALADGRVREQPDTLTFLDQGPQRPPDAELLVQDARAQRDRGPEGEACDTPGVRRCPVEGEPGQLICESDGLWRAAACPRGLVCLGGECLAPEGCEEGARSCGQGEVVVCREGAWQPLTVCAEGLVCAAGRCMSPACGVAAQNRSYVGCEYWPTDLQAYRVRGQEAPVIDNAPMGVVLFNPSADVEARVTLTDPEGGLAQILRNYVMQPPEGGGLPDGGYPQTLLRSLVVDANRSPVGDPIGEADDLPVPPGGRVQMLLPRRGFGAIPSEVRRNAWRLTSDSPVVAYQFNPMCCNYSFSNDASLLIPASALGRDYRFIGVPAQSEGSAELAVVGTEDATRVTLTVPPRVEVSMDEAGRLAQAGNQITVTLDAHEVAMVHVGQGPFDAIQRDLTGVEVDSSAPVAVFSGHHCARAPARLGACDHLEEQLFPTFAWGRSFSLAPLAPRSDPPVPTEVIYWKILADRADTRVTFSTPFAALDALPPANVGATDCASLLADEVTVRLEAGGYCEFGSARPVGLDRDAPLLVAGVISGQLSTGAVEAVGANAGDPSLFLVAPDRQHRADYVFLTPNTYAVDYVTLVAPPGTTLNLDGAELDLAQAHPIPGRDRVVLHVPLIDGVHRLTGSHPFGIVVYAYDDFVSYAFTGGLNLEKE